MHLNIFRQVTPTTGIPVGERSAVVCTACDSDKLNENCFTFDAACTIQLFHCDIFHARNGSVSKHDGLFPFFLHLLSESPLQLSL